MAEKISIIIPVFNEAVTLASILERTLGAPTLGLQKEIIVVNDGSTDQSRQKIAPFASKIMLLEHDSNRGKGAAIRTGLSKATGSFVLIQDSDEEYAPENYPDLIKRLQDDPTPCAVYGSRNLRPAKRGYPQYIFGVWLLTKILNVMFRGTITDSYTCHKLVRKSCLEGLELKTNGFEIELEITAKLLKGGHRIAEVPILYRPRTFAEGKKIRAIDGLKGLLTLAKIALARSK